MWVLTDSCRSNYSIQIGSNALVRLRRDAKLTVVFFDDFSIIDLEAYNASIKRFLNAVKSDRGLLDLPSRRQQGLTIERCTSALIDAVGPNRQTHARKRFDLVVPLIYSELLKNRLSRAEILRLVESSTEWLTDGAEAVPYWQALRNFGTQVDRGKSAFGTREKNVIVFKDGSYCNIYFYRAAIALLFDDLRPRILYPWSYKMNDDFYDMQFNLKLKNLLGGVTSGLALERFEQVSVDARREFKARTRTYYSWDLSVPIVDNVSNLVLAKLSPRSSIGKAKLASARILRRIAQEKADHEKELFEYTERRWQPKFDFPKENPMELSFAEAEVLCQRWMKFLGIKDARITQQSSDGGIDVDSMYFAAQVKHQSDKVGREPIQRLNGAMRDGQIGMFFSLNGYRSTAIEFAMTEILHYSPTRATS